MATLTASQTVVASFDTRARAEQAIIQLRAAGYRDSQIGLVGKDTAARNGATTDTNDANDTNAGEGFGIGAATGAAAGAAIGLGILAGAIPVIGPAIVAGTLGTILSNALGGAAIAGLTGALIGWGVPEEDAKHYEEEVRSGRYLVTVNTEDGHGDPRAIFARNGGTVR